ncbi:MAG: ABC-F family ATP-binding cassette domain-containing protein [Acidimicrobiia bacterium]
MAIDIQSVSFSYPDGTAPIEDVSFTVPTGKVTALVGPNGVGKTTLLELVAGDLESDDGMIRRDTEVAYMRQNPGFDDMETATVLDALSLALPEQLKVLHGHLQFLYQESVGESDGMQIAVALEDWQSLGGYEAEAQWDQVTRAVLGQGMDVASDRKLSELSGGERKAIILMSYLSSDVPTLVLDEPDNFLDLYAKAWLERELNASKKTILLVSHDRTLLTRAVSRMVVLEHNGVWTHGATYATFPAARRARTEKLAKDLDAWQAEERRLFRYYKLLKQRAGASEAMAARADAAESRWQRFKAAGPPPLPPPEKEISLQFEGSRTGKEAIRLTDFEVEGLVGAFSVTIYNGDRIALLGENGVGKSTFLRKLLDKGLLDAGTLRYGPTARLGFFSQDNEIDDGAKPLLDVVMSHFRNENDARSALGRYGLGKHIRHRLDELSGGQKARVQLLILETKRPNVLLLDEPTDNLDLESILIIEEALLDLEATQLAITHDAAFTRVFNRFIIFDRDGVVAETQDRTGALAIASRRGFSLLDEAKVRILSS